MAVIHIAKKNYTTTGPSAICATHRCTTSRCRISANMGSIFTQTGKGQCY